MLLIITTNDLLQKIITTIAIWIILKLNLFQTISAVTYSCVLPLEVIGVALDDFEGCANETDCNAEEAEEAEDGTVTDITLFCAVCGVLYVVETVMGNPLNAAFLAATRAAFEVTKTPNLLLLRNFFTTRSPSKRTVGALYINPNSKSTGTG